VTGSPTLGGDRRPLMIVSNRLPFTMSRTRRGAERRRSVGGLVSALDPVLRERGGTWVGWPGSELRPGETMEQADDPYRIAPVSLSETEVRHYYHGFSNGALWPLFHSFPSRTSFERSDWDAYVAVNDRFARVAVSSAGDAELAWIHDYQLMLAGGAIRRWQPDLRLAFFLHIPFPPYDVYRLLPWDREVLLGVLACDLVGFHVSGYAQNFLDCVERRLGDRVDRDAMVIEHGNRTVKVVATPIGVDFDRYSEAARAAAAGPVAAPDRERIVLGVDRLDYTKGIPERMRAFERLLEVHPQHRGRATLLQLAVPSRAQVAEYRALKRRIDELVGRINGRFATAEWSPIRYLYRELPFEELAALYRDAPVALVTPLRDGMNLVAKEYVACQVADPGVLVLSRLAGAAETMREALLVNPYNIDETAQALHRALLMDESERRSRVTALRRRERRDDVYAWVDSFLDAARATVAAIGPPSAREFASQLDPFLSRAPSRLALFLDYDGTLNPISQGRSDGELPDTVRVALRACAARPDTDVTIVSRRGVGELRRLVDNPAITYAGRHGLEIEGPGLEPFVHPDLARYGPQLNQLRTALDRLAVDGAWVEERAATLTFHFDAVNETARQELAQHARETIRSSGLQPYDQPGEVVARPPISWDKGHAVLHILRTRYGSDWPEHARVIYVGDDQTDEEAFYRLSGLAATYRVRSGESLTAAGSRLPTADSVHALLRWLADRPGTGEKAYNEERNQKTLN
jgi:trehalose 6-phosphate synthase/phosphatase